jgi:hypothetical protein
MWSQKKIKISLSPGACLREAASAKAGVRGHEKVFFTLTLTLPPQGGGVMEMEAFNEIETSEKEL